MSKKRKKRKAGVKMKLKGLDERANQEHEDIQAQNKGRIAKEKRGGWNKGKAHNLVYISRELRKGKHPSELGAKEAGRGVQKIAWVISIREVNSEVMSEIIIKNKVQGYRQPTPPPDLEKHGWRLAKVTKAGVWTIQEKVTPIANIPMNHPEFNRARNEWLKFDRMYSGYDLHAANVGIDSKGQLVVFDW